jgi:hypothetical protein
MNHIAEDAHLMTEEHRGYKSAGKIRRHDSVNHIKEEWVRGNAHTNSIENYWSLFKRGLIGSFHRATVQWIAGLCGSTVKRMLLFGERLLLRCEGQPAKSAVRSFAIRFPPRALPPKYLRQETAWDRPSSTSHMISRGQHGREMSCD